MNGPVAENDPNNLWRARAAEKIREYFLAGLKPDIVHVPCLFRGWHDDVVSSIGAFDQSGHTTTILPGLASLLPQQSHQPDPHLREYRLRKLQSLRNADFLLAVSDSSRQEASATLGFDSASIITVSEGLDQDRFKPRKISRQQKDALLRRHQITRPFIMSVPGDPDTRINLPGLLTAYSHLDSKLRSTHQLLILGESHHQSYEHIRQHARSAGLQDVELVFAARVPDDELIALYNLCKLFVFPALYGVSALPVLEPMACGAPVIASNTTSTPEAITRPDALFVPTRPEAIAKTMQDALADDGFRRSLRQHALSRAKEFSFDRVARRTWAAFESQHKPHSQRIPASVAAPQRKPRLAFVSPLPPERTGIADYSAELVPELARFYDITLIIDQPNVDDASLTANFPTRSVSWLQTNGDRFDRVLYQLGNSQFHKHMFALLKQHPGVVVLHDFFLGHAIHWMEATGYLPTFFRQSLYLSHGYPGLLALEHQGAEAAQWSYPCNKLALDEADGAIVHSQYAVDAARRWYGDEVATQVVRIPQLRSLPLGVNRDQARALLGIRADDFLVCSFGILNQTKLNHRLIEAWLGSSLLRDRRCHLVFVGENGRDKYGKALLERICKSGSADKIQMTGHIGFDRYQQYLEAADLVVQLRTASRGETSRSVLDALAHGLALLVNAHGPVTEYPDDILVKLPDDFTDTALIAALEDLRNDSTLRRQLGMAARRYTAEFHNPRKVAEEYRRAIEHFARLGAKARCRDLLDSVARLAAPLGPSQADLVAAAESIASNTPQAGQRQLLVDVSVLARHDLKTGIERVARSLLLQLLNSPPAGCRVEPIRCERGIYHYARRLTLDMLGIGKAGLRDDKIDVQRNDIFLGLDSDPGDVARSRELFKRYAARGLEVFFVVHDTLPASHPEFFPPDCSAGFERWLETVVEVSNGLACVSQCTVETLRTWLDARPPRRAEPLHLGHFCPGADIASSAPTSGLPEGFSAVLHALNRAASFLMVGTIEPRKGYSQALSAFEQLWSEKMEVNLVIVGREGWKNVEPRLRQHIVGITRRIRGHTEFGKRLLWLEGISDEYLEKVYAASACLIAASEAEGFGLPLIEAAQQKLPIIARDIPVFREVAGKYAFYFDGLEPKALAEAVKAWMALRKRQRVPLSAEMPRLTWDESARRLSEMIVNGRWDRAWKPASRDQFA
jgi:glycosyltransferase involved in cell wall biosynthesis